eukprot:979004-Amphidinium_carterae.3
MPLLRERFNITHTPHELVHVCLLSPESFQIQVKFLSRMLIAYWTQTARTEAIYVSGVATRRLAAQNSVPLMRISPNALMTSLLAALRAHVLGWMAPISLVVDHCERQRRAHYSRKSLHRDADVHNNSRICTTHTIAIKEPVTGHKTLKSSPPKNRAEMGAKCGAEIFVVPKAFFCTPICTPFCAVFLLGKQDLWK